VFTKKNHTGDAILEWVVLIALVVVVGGVVAYTVATQGGAEGTATGNWIKSLNVPSAHP